MIEDDYDAEYRYDSPPLAALQGLAPERVVYMGTVSKTLAPALRLGWLVLPPRLIDPVIGHKLLADHGCPTIDQLALARLFEGAAYHRHLRKARRRNRARRDVLAAAGRVLPGAHVSGMAAGLHARVRLPHPVDGLALCRRPGAFGRRLPGDPTSEIRPEHDRSILGYANLSEPAIAEGIRRLGVALTELEVKGTR